jgi:hypothetical protein
MFRSIAKFLFPSQDGHLQEILLWQLFTEQYWNGDFFLPNCFHRVFSSYIPALKIVSIETILMLTLYIFIIGLYSNKQPVPSL